ncbi:MAG: twin-arginine translocase subunit TatC [Gammaproteobacteria bacterium]|nr:twin-arginine translocase subunit TatC [Gammaproteobacteria bacterium]
MTGAGPRDRDPELPLIAHLIELRARLLRCLIVLAAIFLAMVPFANDIYAAVAGPLLAKLPVGSAMIATEVAAPFVVPFKLCLFAALFAAMPFVLYQIWAFVAPGLYDNERRFAVPLLLTSILLFYAGLAFAFFVVFPLIFGFFTAVAPEGVAVMTDIGRYLDFVLKLFFAFGVVFEVPVATVLLIWTGLISAAALARGRPYIILGAFALGALLTPGPDVLSQILLALPLWLLFEIGLFLGRLKAESGK